MIFHYSIIITSKGMKKRALCPLSGVHLTIKPLFAPFVDDEEIVTLLSGKLQNGRKIQPEAL